MAQKRCKPLSRRGHFWLNHVLEWQRSGVTQVQYCQEQNLSVATFRWWNRHLIRSNRVRSPQEGFQTEPATTFTEILMPGGSEAAAAYQYEILLPNHTQLRLRRNFDAEAVSTLVSLLVATC